MEIEERSKIRVALVAPSMKLIGGQSIQADRLFSSFKNNADVEMTFVENNPSTIFQKITILRTIFASIKFSWSLFKKLPNADVVHTFASGSSGYLIATLPVLFFAKLLRKPVILNYHSGELEQHIAEWKLSALPTMKLFDKIIVPTQFLVNVFAKFGLKAEAIFNSVDAEKYSFRERKPLQPVFLSNRNFEVHYQVSDILRAFQIIKKSLPDAKLLIAGSGREESKLKQLAEDLDLTDVDFLGKIDPLEMPKIYNQADIYLNSSIVDNMPLSLIEAFACGLPVVSTNTGGIPFIIDNERTGLLVPTSEFKLLANGALRLIEDQILAQLLIENGRKEIAKYDQEKLRDLWINQYCEVKKCE